MDRNHSRRLRATAGLLCVGLGACTSTPQRMATMSPVAQSAQAGMNVRDDANILALLHTSNVGEIMAGMLAQQRATDTAVKAFAGMMVTEHTALDQQGTALAQQYAELKTALQSQVRPAVAQHLAQAREIQSRIGGSGMPPGGGIGTSATHGGTTTSTSGGSVTEPKPDSTRPKAP